MASTDLASHGDLSAAADQPPTSTQGALFDIGPSGDCGFRGPMAAQIVGITYRQLDYWTRTELVKPSVQSAAGSGSARLYGFADLVVLRTVKRLLDTGISLQSVRVAIDFLAQTGVTDLSGVTLISDGASVYMCTEPGEVLDLLAGGQGVFAIGLTSIVGETTAAIAGLPSDAVVDPAVLPIAARTHIASAEGGSHVAGLGVGARRLRAIS